VGLYKFAGVDVVREQVEAGLANTGCEYDIQPEGLVLRSLPQPEDEIVCPMHDTVHPTPQQLQLESERAPVPPLEGLIFARLPIKWQRWVSVWQEEQKGVLPQLLPPETMLMPRPVTPGPAPAVDGVALPPVPTLPQPAHTSGNGPATSIRE
jgi:hypothetical protein